MQLRRNITDNDGTMAAGYGVSIFCMLISRQQLLEPAVSWIMLLMGIIYVLLFFGLDLYREVILPDIAYHGFDPADPWHKRYRGELMQSFAAMLAMKLFAGCLVAGTMWLLVIGASFAMLNMFASIWGGLVGLVLLTAIIVALEAFWRRRPEWFPQ